MRGIGDTTRSVCGMSSVGIDSGHNLALPKRFAGPLPRQHWRPSLPPARSSGPTTPSDAAGENRTISLYHVHTKESLTITYKVNGRYIPSAMTKINHLMRDWRRNEIIKMDPETVDLMWELHADLGSTGQFTLSAAFAAPRPMPS